MCKCVCSGVQVYVSEHAFGGQRSVKCHSSGDSLPFLYCFKDVFSSVCIWCSVYVTAGAQEGQKCLTPGDGVTGYYEPPDVSAKN